MNIFNKVCILVFCMFLAPVSSISGQKKPNSLCGNSYDQKSADYLNSIKPQLKKYEQAFIQMKNSQSKTNISIINSIPIKAHVIRTSNGLGGIDSLALQDALVNLNVIYADAFMEFFLCDDINYIDDDAFYHIKKGNENKLTESNNVSGVINIYFTDYIENSSEESICGYSDNVGKKDVIFMKNSCAINDSSLAHEMGHFFSLIHTHGSDNLNKTTELVDGSNCDTDGDGICDTPADPKLTYSNVNNFCKYVGSETDAHGNSYAPDTGNIMSYSMKGCRNHFTPQQLSRMRAFYLTAKNYLACPSFNADFSVDANQTCDDILAVNFKSKCSNITKWEWDIDTDGIVDYYTQNPTHIYKKGSYDVTLTVSNKSKTIKKTFSKLIKVGTEPSLLNEDFEDFEIYNNQGWTAIDVSGNGYNWISNSGKTPSENTGPLIDNTKNDTIGTYMYAEASGAQAGDVSLFISPCINITDANKSLRFSYHMFGKNVGELHIDIKTNSEYIYDAMTAITGSQQIYQDDAFMSKSLDLSEYAGQTIKVYFRAIRGISWDADIAIDDIFIVDHESSNSNDDVVELLDIKVFPNPITNNMLHVNISDSESHLNYQICNIMGQVFLSGRVSNAPIDVSSLNSGSYLLVLSNKKSRIVKKLIK